MFEFSDPVPVARILWLALPVALAAAVHLVVIRFDLGGGLKVPMDFGASLGGRRILGDHKTWRGALVMIAGSSGAMALQGWLRAPSLEFFDYGEVETWICGAALGLGFVLAELPNSFLKRRLSVPPGERARGPLYPVCTLLDQLDSIVGCLIALAFFWTPPLVLTAWILLLGAGIHVAFNFASAAIGLKEHAL